MYDSLFLSKGSEEEGELHQLRYSVTDKACMPDASKVGGRDLSLFWVKALGEFAPRKD